MSKTVSIKDKFGKVLKVGDTVLFADDSNILEGEITSFYYEEWFCIDQLTKLGYTKLNPILTTTTEEEVKNRSVFASIGYDGEYDEDHYGHIIEGTYHFKKYARKNIHGIVRKDGLTWDDFMKGKKPIGVEMMEVNPSNLTFDSAENKSVDWTIQYQRAICEKCQLYDGYDLCMANGNFGAIGCDSIGKCISRKLFIKKDDV